jgi:hypothetical protein
MAASWSAHLLRFIISSTDVVTSGRMSVAIERRCGADPGERDLA